MRHTRPAPDRAHAAAQAKIRAAVARGPRKPKVGKLTVKNLMDNEPKTLRRVPAKHEAPAKKFTPDEIAKLLAARPDLH